MSKLSFSITGANAEPFAVAPQLALCVRIEEATGVRVHAIALRAQVMLEPQRRGYSADETPRLIDLFGTPERYGDTLRPMLWTHVAQTVLAFEDSTQFDLPIPCSYDFQVAAHKFIAGLEDGEIPINLLFSGTVFVRGDDGTLRAEFVPWTCEAHYRLPVAVWREAMDAHFPNQAWLRVSREVYDELVRWRNAGGLPSWDETMTRLIESAQVQS
ncbi:MAG: DUF6084 family protein [Candidatus Velthaea sp.]